VGNGDWDLVDRDRDELVKRFLECTERNESRVRQKEGEKVSEMKKGAGLKVNIA
jgi:hypothetical protein